MRCVVDLVCAHLVCFLRLFCESVICRVLFISVVDCSCITYYLYIRFATIFLFIFFFFLMIRRPPRSTQSRSSAASDVYKRQGGNIHSRKLS